MGRSVPVNAEQRKKHSIETNYQLFCDEEHEDDAEGGMSDGLVGNTESSYCEQFYACLPILLPPCQNQPEPQ